MYYVIFLFHVNYCRKHWAKWSRFNSSAYWRYIVQVYSSQVQTSFPITAFDKQSHKTWARFMLLLPHWSLEWEGWEFCPSPLYSGALLCFIMFKMLLSHTVILSLPLITNVKHLKIIFLFKYQLFKYSNSIEVSFTNINEKGLAWLDMSAWLVLTHARHVYP